MEMTREILAMTKGTGPPQELPLLLGLVPGFQESSQAVAYQELPQLSWRPGPLLVVAGKSLGRVQVLHVLIGL